MPFDVAVLHPGRTLLEKLVLIDALAQKLAVSPSLPVPARNGRHFYDVFQLAGDDRVRRFLRDDRLVSEVMASVNGISRQYFGGTNADLHSVDRIAASPAFDPGSSVSARFRAGYEATMPDLYFGVSPLPSWEAICARIVETLSLP